MRYIMQIITHILIYCLEILLAVFLINKFTHLPYLEAYAVYQIAVFVILHNIDSIRKDELLAYLNFLRQCKLALESGEPAYIDRLEKISKLMQEDRSALISKKIRNLYKQSMTLLKIGGKGSLLQLENDIIMTEHSMAMLDFSWRYSFLLRIVK